MQPQLVFKLPLIFLYPASYFCNLTEVFPHLHFTNPFWGRRMGTPIYPSAFHIGVISYWKLAVIPQENEKICALLAQGRFHVYIKTDHIYLTFFIL